MPKDGNYFGFGFTTPDAPLLIPIGWESGASFVNQLKSVVMENQSKREITFDTQLKTALMLNRSIHKEQSWTWQRYDKFRNAVS